MSVAKRVKYISNQETIPIVADSGVFYGHEDKRFAIGVYSPEQVMSYQPDSVIQAYLRLRANVYVDQAGILGNDSKRHDGTELDENDERSTHFVVLENLVGKVAARACSRLIIKDTAKDQKLPIEDFFPEVFSDGLPPKSIEVSRFIARVNDDRYDHEAKRNQLTAKQRIILAELAYACINDLGPVFAIVEKNFGRDLRVMGVPTSVVAEPKIIPEYNSENLGLEIDKFGFRDKVGKTVLDSMTVHMGSFGYWGDISRNSDIEA